MHALGVIYSVTIILGTLLYYVDYTRCECKMSQITGSGSCAMIAMARNTYDAHTSDSGTYSLMFS